MTTKKFIEKTTQKLFQTFSTLEFCRYAFDKLSNTHYFLIDNEVYSSKEFAEFDYVTTSSAFDCGIQGLICFITDDEMFDFADQEIFHNYFNNEVILKNLVHLIEPNFHFAVKSSDLNISFAEEAKKAGMGFAGENTWALAA